jgi:hypothetical protein
VSTFPKELPRDVNKVAERRGREDSVRPRRYCGVLPRPLNLTLGVQLAVPDSLTTVLRRTYVAFAVSLLSGVLIDYFCRKYGHVVAPWLGSSISFPTLAGFPWTEFIPNAAKFIPKPFSGIPIFLSKEIGFALNASLLTFTVNLLRLRRLSPGDTEARR